MIFDINEDIENLTQDEVVLLLKSIHRDYTFYSSSQSGHIFKFSIGELHNPNRRCVNVLELHIDRYIWECVNHVDDDSMPGFYACYKRIIRDRQLNIILQ